MSTLKPYMEAYIAHVKQKQELDFTTDKDGCVSDEVANWDLKCHERYLTIKDSIHDHIAGMLSDIRTAQKDPVLRSSLFLDEVAKRLDEIKDIVGDAVFFEEKEIRCKKNAD